MYAEILSTVYETQLPQAEYAMFVLLSTVVKFSEFGTKFKREIPLVLELSEFPYNAVNG